MADVLLERLPLSEIVAYFDAHGFSPRVHSEAPRRPTEDEWKQLPRAVRNAWPSHAYWVDLSRDVRWYGGGDTEEAAIRSAAQRWRIEQIGTDSERKPDPLP